MKPGRDGGRKAKVIERASTCEGRQGGSERRER